jgi:hypothetical protein
MTVVSCESELERKYLAALEERKQVREAAVRRRDGATTQKPRTTKKRNQR